MLELQLQRFAGEKTERATPQRRQEARREGQVARSSELTSALSLFALIAGLRVFGGHIWSGWVSVMKTDLGNAQRPDFTQIQLVGLVDGQIITFLKLLLPLLALAVFVGGIASFAQVGVLFVPKHVMPDLKRIDPISGFKRMFSLRSTVEAIKSILKLAVVGLVAYSVVRGAVGTIEQMYEVSITAYPRLVGDLIFRMAIEIAALMLVLGALDFFYQRYDFEKSIRMSKDDIKDEHKREEGDDQIKGRIRQRGRALATQRMMQEVEKADVVVTNPTHYAVAMVYDTSRALAPLVVAKGQDDMARRIRERAKEAKVALVENKPLAQALYRLVDIGDVIPEDLFQAVAEVLAYVYRLNNKAGR
ncbi:flagellar biosynthesis protein FlhB [Alicyclobacillus sp. SO9]|uniref:flagellar biosynthesis protein FlhB n=1 Tax=Alicyclobacillus sp. SO9 TaxID=2665646 RepID=UPI0018E8E911|nr:flagellar biosynthesis protein FlhB [Alicyclobacillus sp. SO9]QQE80820.1 flagellar biosynthesis protein FlhB [Alicyclobacillus sp. SO9]